MSEGQIKRIIGSLVIASGVEQAQIGEVVNIGEEQLIGEIINLKEGEITIQCYENTAGVRPRDPVLCTGHSLTAELGPGLLGSIYDGLQRSESKMLEEHGYAISRGVKTPALSPDRKWHFIPKVKSGSKVVEGDVIGTVKESSTIEHRILVPNGIRGTLGNVEEGDFTVQDILARVKTERETKNLTLSQKWPVRIPRPYVERLNLNEPLITGQRVIDMFFPIAKGGTSCVPGGFGTGKTVLLQQFAKWSDVDIVVYIGCGERGNEMADLLNSFPKLEDPRTGSRLIERTIMIANVSNMPVSAREASIYFGITIAEYYRDQGYDVAVIADSTSRWAEALRDISGRLEEIPAESGYPAYISDRIASFYERAGRIVSLGSKRRVGSVTVIGAISPPAGDFSEPVTSHTLRFVQTLWALDTELAYHRHFPAINWIKSYSRYVEYVAEWWRKYATDWVDLWGQSMRLLQEASEIEGTASIIGEQALPDEQRLILFTLKMIKDGFLMQDATDEIDSYSEAEKQVELLRLITTYYTRTKHLVDQGIPVEKVEALPVAYKIMMAKRVKGIEQVKNIYEEITKEAKDLEREYGLG